MLNAVGSIVQIVLRLAKKYEADPDVHALIDAAHALIDAIKAKSPPSPPAA